MPDGAPIARKRILHEDNDLWTLAYLPQWVSPPGSFDLSPALPRSRVLPKSVSKKGGVVWDGLDQNQFAAD